jgi:hypothetical protein
MNGNERQFEAFLRDIKFDDTPDPTHRDTLEKDLLTILSKQSPRQVEFWRTIMKAKITKLAAAAVIVFAVVLSITFLDKSVTPPAYALEQTIEANHTIQTVHLRIWRSKSEFKDCWIKYDDAGLLSNLRQNFYGDVHDNDDNLRFTVWNEGVLKTWMPLKNVVIVTRVNNEATGWEDFAETYDPKLTLQRLYDDSRENEAIELEIHEPVQGGDLIYIEAINSGDKTRLELAVDPETKLVKELSRYHLENQEYEFVMRIEYLSYNQPINLSVFELSAIPDDALIYDQVDQLVGLEKGDLTDDEIAVKVVRECLEATIAHDYEEVSRLMEGDPGDSVEVFLEEELGAKLTLIVSIGQPEPHERWPNILCVPCEIEIEDEDSEKRIVSIYATAKAIGYQPGCRWIVHTEMKVIHEPIRAKFGEEITAKVAQFDINNATPDDVIEVFGEPSEYIWGKKVFRKDELPDPYIMVYAGGYFHIVIRNGRVIELRLEHQDIGYVFAETIRIGSSLEEVLKVIGAPTKTVVGKEIRWSSDGVLYKDIDEKGHCYYRRRDQGVRMFFKDYKLFALYLTRTEPLPSK